MNGYLITTGEGHLADGVLMQLLDGEPLTTAGASDHLLSCEGCAERLGGLRKAAGLLHDSLADVAMPEMRLPVAGRRRRPWVISLPVAAAASFVILASAAAATPSVRDWIIRGIGGAKPPASGTGTSPAAAAPAVAGIIASFSPSDTVLVIRIGRRQAQGGIELSASADDRVSAQAIGGTAGEELVVLPGELRITNAVTSTADYRIRVPASVRVVRVVVDGSDVALVRNAGSLRRRIELH